jgi:hypothetical protein
MKPQNGENRNHSMGRRAIKAFKEIKSAFTNSPALGLPRYDEALLPLCA